MTNPVYLLVAINLIFTLALLASVLYIIFYPLEQNHKELKEENSKIKFLIVSLKKEIKENLIKSFEHKIEQSIDSLKDDMENIYYGKTADGQRKSFITAIYERVSSEDYDGDIVNVKKVIEDLTDKIEKCNEDITNASKESEKARTEIEKFSIGMKEMSKGINTGEENQENQQDDTDQSIHFEHKSFLGQLNFLIKKTEGINELLDKRSDVIDTLGNIKEKIEGVTGKIDELPKSEDISRHTDDIQRFNEKTNELLTKINDASKNIDSSNGDVEQANFSSALATLLNDYSDVNSTNRDLKTEIENLEQKLTRHESANEKFEDMQNKVETIEKEKDKLNIAKELLEKKLKEMESQFPEDFNDIFNDYLNDSKVDKTKLRSVISAFMALENLKKSSSKREVRSQFKQFDDLIYECFKSSPNILSQFREGIIESLNEKIISQYFKIEWPKTNDIFQEKIHSPESELGNSVVAKVKSAVIYDKNNEEIIDKSRIVGK